LAIRSSKGDTYSIGGIQGSPNLAWEKINNPRMMRIPSQKDGMATPAMEKIRTT